MAVTTTTAPPSVTVGTTVLAGAALPSESQCKQQVVPTKEVRSGNNTANHTTGNARAATAGNWGSNAGAAADLNRVTGDYTGTTDEIIQWGACKWGFSADQVRAQAMIESSWNQSIVGGWVADNGHCASAQRRTTPSTSTTTSLGSTSTTAPFVSAYQCPTAFGLMQLRSDFQPGTYPMSAKSTSFNVDYALAMERACYDGVSWLGSQTRGDLWGCIGAYYSGQWHDAAGLQYANSVKAAMISKIWVSI